MIGELETTWFLIIMSLVIVIAIAMIWVVVAIIDN
jgi:hypothetical protein